MAEPLPKQKLDTAVSPEKIVKQTFEVERRGFDQRQVQSYLRAIADALRDAQQREAEMRSRLGKAVRRAERAEKAARDSGSEDDPAELTRQIGNEVTAVLDAARAAGEQRITAAEKSAEQLMSNAKLEATEIRHAAESVMDERSAEADAAANEIIAEAKSTGAALRSKAEAEAESIRNEAAGRVARTRDECDALIREAEEARMQILEDMDRRRRQARAQVERLRVGRDRLLRSYEVVRRTLDETTVELKMSLKEAKVRGDTAARTVAAEPLASRHQLEAELADAKLIGRLGKPDHKSVLESKALPRPLDPPQVPNIDLRGDGIEAPTPKRPKVPTSKVPETPVPPAIAPIIKETNEDTEAKGAKGATEAELDELAELTDDDLDIVEPSDEIEHVVALDDPDGAIAEVAQTAGQDSGSEQDGGGSGGAADPAHQPAGLFAALRQQASREPDQEPQGPVVDLADARDAVIVDGATQLERRLKRALADEQNELLAAIRAANKRNPVELIEVVGDIDVHLARYVWAINEAAAATYGAGAALIDSDPRPGELPAGAVEELLGADVISPIRQRLTELDAVEVESPQDHLDPIRAYYRQRKTDHLSDAASSLARLLCVAGVCDGLPAGAPLPWSTSSEPRDLRSRPTGG